MFALYLRQEEEEEEEEKERRCEERTNLLM
jgi:hypothetical protein